MEKLTVCLNNCYGIGTLDHEFDFSGFNTQLIYASNGIMKTSFANTFRAIEKGDSPKDRLYNKTSNWTINAEQSELSKEKICVIKSFEDINSGESQSKLLIDEDSKAEYDELLNEINTEKDKLIREWNRKSGVAQKELESTILHDFETLNFFKVLQNYVNETRGHDNFNIKYTDIINKDVIDFLNIPDVKEHIQEYFETYNQLIRESSVFVAGVFNPSRADNVRSSLRKENFFQANHKVKLNGIDIEFSSDAQIDAFFLEQKRNIIENDNLKRIEESIKKVAVHGLKEILETRDILSELFDLNTFKKKLWKSYFSESRMTIELTLDIYNRNLARLEEIEELAAKQQTKWDNVIEVFNTRFFVPFSAKIGNKISSILGKQVPVIEFSFVDLETGNEVIKRESEFKGEDLLSQGERRAMYLLNVIFKIEAHKQSGNKILFIVDDIADSFDYKNKYAILQYLKEISEVPLFSQIILTHNYDFFRTVQSRLFPGSAVRSNCYLARRVENSIYLEIYGHKFQTNPFNDWKTNLGDKQKFIASIPFVRNIIEFQKDENSSEFMKLTSLLHLKSDSRNIKVSEVKTIYDEIIQSNGLDQIDQTKSVLEILEEELDVIIYSSDNGFELHKKVLISIGIRLKAEEYMWSKITDQTTIRKNQTYQLFSRFKTEYGSSLVAECKILDQVNLITPENIHLNSFMFEPILDLSIDHLKQLYIEVTTLN
jgi:hypothetical protein